VSCLGSGVSSHCPSSSQSRRTAASHLSVMGPIQWACPQATRSFLQGCSRAMTPHPVGRDAQVSDPSRHGAMTSMACGQRRMVGRNSSITDRLWSVGQAVHTMTVNGRSVGRREEVNVPRPGRPRRGQSQVLSFSNPSVLLAGISSRTTCFSGRESVRCTAITPSHGRS
jgi:hypothetical protein